MVAVFSLFMIFAISYKYRVNRYAYFLLAINLALGFLSSIFSGSVVFLPYFLTFCTLFLGLSKKGYLSYFGYVFKLTCAAFLVIVIVTMRESGSGRFTASFVDDPNYTAMPILCLLLLIYATVKSANSQFKKLLIFGVAAATIILTQSRLAFVALLMFFLFRSLGQVLYRKYLNRLLYAYLLLTVVLPLGFWLLFESLGLNDVGRNSLSLFDESNYGRALGVMYAYERLITDTDFVLYGIGSADNLFDAGFLRTPHHWFSMLWASCGLLYALSSYTNICFVISRVPNEYLAYLAVVFTYMGGLSVTAMFMPLVFLSLFLITQKHRVFVDLRAA